MEVLLCKDVEKLGRMGEVVRVAEGYARNFLLPHRLALPATAENKRWLERETKRQAVQEEQRQTELRELAGKLRGKSVTIPVKVGENKQLYGSVTVPLILEALQAEGFALEARLVELAAPIRELGVYDVPLRLGSEEPVALKVWVVEE